MPVSLIPSLDLVRVIVAREAAIVGIDPAFVINPAFRCYSQEAVIVRARVSLKLLDMGKYSTTGIAKRLGIYHTSVMYYKKTRSKWLV